MRSRGAPLLKKVGRKLLRSRSSSLKSCKVVEEASRSCCGRRCRGGTASSRAASRFREGRWMRSLGRRRLRHGGARVCHLRAPDAAGVLRGGRCFSFDGLCLASITWYVCVVLRFVRLLQVGRRINCYLPCRSAPNSTCLRLVHRSVGRARHAIDAMENFYSCWLTPSPTATAMNLRRDDLRRWSQTTPGAESRWRAEHDVRNKSG